MEANTPAPLPDPTQTLPDALAGTIKSVVPKAVAFVLTPLLLPIAGAVSFWLQKKVGIKMDPAEATGFVTSIVAGAGLVAYKWLEGRAAYDKTILEIYKFHQLGSSPAPQQPPPVGQ